MIEIANVYILDSISPKSTHKWFYNFYFFEGFHGLEKLDMSNCVDTSYMFANCGYLSYNPLNLNDMSDWDMSNVINMSHMFEHAPTFGYLYTYGDISKWDVSNCEDMSNMFYWMQRESGDILDLSIWNVSNVTKHDDFVGESSPLFDNNNEHVIVPNWVN